MSVFLILRTPFAQFQFLLSFQFTQCIIMDSLASFLAKATTALNAFDTHQGGNQKFVTQFSVNLWEQKYFICDK